MAPAGPAGGLEGACRMQATGRQVRSPAKVSGLSCSVIIQESQGVLLNIIKIGADKLT